MRLGVFVGSFDPIHVGHIKVMDYLIENNYLDKIVILPTLSYWHKNDLTDVNIRFEMIKKIKKNYLIVDNKNNKYKYTYEVMDAFKKEYKNDELFLIISADNIVDFDKWYKVDELLKYKVIVLNRNNINIKKYVNKFKEKEQFIIIQNFPFINISSTSLRSNVDKNYLDENVYKYIVKNNLYKK